MSGKKSEKSIGVFIEIIANDNKYLFYKDNIDGYSIKY